MFVCKRCGAYVNSALQHYDDNLGCWQCKPDKERASLLAWFERTDLASYQTAALQEAYKALTEYED